MERAGIQAELADSFRQVHSRVRWYGIHEHEYNDLEETAKKANLPFKPYQQQTPEERDATEKTVLTWCMQKVEKSAELLQGQRLAAERHQVERRAVGASVAAQYATNPVLAALVAIPPRQAGKMKLEEVRVAC